MSGTVAGDLAALAMLRPDEAQAVFRAVLDALSRPGSVTRLPAGPSGGLPAPLLPLLALADLGTGCRVLGPDRHWAEAVAVAVNAPQVPLGEARLVAALRAMTADELRVLCRGSAAAPEDGALACVPVLDVAGGPRRWRLSGPGVRDGSTIAPDGISDGFCAARSEAVAGFPAGVDLLLVAPDGRMVGLPRSTTVVEEE